MSDGQPNVEGTEPPEGVARLANPLMGGSIDPDFAAVWNEVYGEEGEDGPAEEPGQAEAGAGGDAAPAPAGEGAGADPAPAGAPAAGADPNAGAGAPAPAPEAGAADAGAAAATAVVAGELDATAVIPQFAVATEQITQRLNASFEAAAMDELRSKADPKYFEALEMHPFRLVGQTVPSLIPGQPDIKLRDTQEAKDWQEATKQLFDEEAKAIVKERQAEIQPIMGVIQDSVALFQNNPDLIPRTKQYDKELADRVMEIGKAYEYRVGDKLLGYHTNMQPIINAIRADLAKSRPTADQAARTEQQRQQAAGQARTEGGQFTVDGPQAGITSKSGMQGEEGEDYSAFISAMGLPTNLFI